MGEIHMRANLQPTTAVPWFAVKYAIVIFPFQAAGFKPLNRAYAVEPPGASRWLNRHAVPGGYVI